jgi:hypothetical protein
MVIPNKSIYLESLEILWHIWTMNYVGLQAFASEIDVKSQPFSKKGGRLTDV